MSGHSKWATIKHKKGAIDAKRGKLFTKILREITIAAKMGGSDMNTNPRLRTACQSARDSNMPKDTIERAVKKGAGELEGISYEDFTFEGYASGGVAIMFIGATDNKKRTTPEIRHALAKHGGNLGETGCVSYMFDRKGVIIADAGSKTEDEMMEISLEAGADDFELSEGICRITCAPETIQSVREAVEAKGLKIESAKVEFVPKSTIKVEDKDAERVLKLISALEDHDDVSEVYANYDISPELMEKFSE